MARKGKAASNAAVVSAVVGTGLLAPALAWAHWSRPGHLAGLAAGTLAGLLIAPLLAVAFIAAPAALAAMLVPRRWRARYRHRRDREAQRSARIPLWLRKAVLRTDRHRCVACKARASLQLDHVIPWSAGGLTALFNMVVLCGRCNRIKSNYWRSRDGRVHYRPFADANLPRQAAAILAKEQRARRSPLRWYRACWALG